MDDVVAAKHATGASRWLWLGAAIVYGAFCWWYTNTGGVLSASEIERFAEAMRANGSPPERIANLRRFMEEDDGKQFLMVNVLDFAANPPPVAGVADGEPASALMTRYMAHMYPQLLKRACHPTFGGSAVFQAMDMQGVDGLRDAERWTAAGIVRYRSRRDLLEIALAPVFSEKHQFKVAALAKTIAYPVTPTLYLSDLRVLLFLVLVSVVAMMDRFAVARGRR